ncbi:hypothetical protein [Apilactobacillus quenuiae]|uniref:hypothetical protein n=1 Tax=Apilactobacillus quenuiae TaxID=2008377 RepID=UPI000D01E2D2|nr:hypothetical protein [Apilactobacillus quenuiae]
MFKKLNTFLLILVLLLTLVNFKDPIKTSANNLSLKTVAKTTPAIKIKSYKDAYAIVMKYHNTNTKNSSYKNAGKVKNGYAIAYYNDVDQLTVYRVTLDKDNIVKIQKNHSKKIVNLNNKKLYSSKDAINALNYALPYRNTHFKVIKEKPNMYVVKVFKNNKYLGIYSLKSTTKKYNKIVEDDSRFQLSAGSHEKILNNKESKKLSNAVKIIRKYINKKLKYSESKQFNKAKKLITYYNSPY